MSALRSLIMSAEFATQVVRQLTQEGYVAYWAAGCVRDYLRGEAPQDYDIATNATPQQVRTLFGARRSLAVGESFGVVIVLGAKGTGESVEVATFRREGDYLDGRRPSSVEFCTAEEDASRRDFTINGMFYDPLTQKVHDFVGGEKDLQLRIVRAIGNPTARMVEDKLRMLRAVRFAASLEFTLELETANAVTGMADQIQIVSAERIAQEFRRMLAGRHRARAMQLSCELGLLNVILPEVLQQTIAAGDSCWSRRLLLLEALEEATFPLGLAAVLRDVPSPMPLSSHQAASSSVEAVGTVFQICRRMKLSNAETNQISWLVANKGSLRTLPQSSLAQIKRIVSHPNFADLLKLERTADRVDGLCGEAYPWIDEFLQRTPAEEIHPVPLLTGNDLLNLGIPAGPRFKDWLIAIRDAQLNREIATREEAISLIRQWWKNSSDSTNFDR